jgi:predicted Ser/Thr protein kinase
MAIDFTDPKWRFEERVERLVNRGRTKKEAEEIVKWVIEHKEYPDYADENEEAEGL